MLVVHKISELKAYLKKQRKAGCSVGLVPTMGALHQGHASLVRRSVAENDVTVVSVFLNPTQFNDKTDLEKYPRTLEADCHLLEECGAQVAFAPSVEEVYPEPDTRHFSYPPTDSVMEGAMRPGHFNGVCQVVSRLFYIVKPTRAYFGEKDWQQIAVVKAMVRHLGISVQIVECDIIVSPFDGKPQIVTRIHHSLSATKAPDKYILSTISELDLLRRFHAKAKLVFLTELTRLQSRAGQDWDPIKVEMIAVSKPVDDNPDIVGPAVMKAIANSTVMENWFHSL